MKCQILFSRKNKENIINSLSAEFAHRVVKDIVIIETLRMHPPAARYNQSTENTSSDGFKQYSSQTLITQTTA